MKFEPHKILVLIEAEGVRKVLVSEARIASVEPVLINERKNTRALKVTVEFVRGDGTVEPFVREHPYADRDLAHDKLLEKILNHYNLQ